VGPALRRAAPALTSPPGSFDDRIFDDRADAGRRLAAALEWRLSPGPAAPGAVDLGPVVLGMARGGVPVAHEVARILGAALDVLVVRKLGHPEQPELGLGALAEDGVRVVNDALVARLAVAPAVIEEVAAREGAELERRRRLYRGDRPPLDLTGRVAVVGDDGLATGYTARAAVELLRRRGAGRVVLAVPVGSPDTVASLRAVADDVVCLTTTTGFSGISQWYRNFDQVTDDDVARLLGPP